MIRTARKRIPNSPTRRTSRRKRTPSPRTRRTTKTRSRNPDEKKDEKAPKPVEIDLADFEHRAVVLPPKAGNYGDLIGVSGKLVFRRLPRAGAAEERSNLCFYDLEKREEKTICDDVDDVILAAKGDKMLVRRKTDLAIIEPKEAQKFDKKVPVSSLETVVDPVREWEQLFTEAWRLQRDYFYDPGMHGVNWAQMRERYGAMLKGAVTRWDVNYILGELIGELSSSHTYRSGGDLENTPQRPVGYLGVDFALENGKYRIKRIIDGGIWDAEDRSPLQAPRRGCERRRLYTGSERPRPRHRSRSPTPPSRAWPTSPFS